MLSKIRLLGLALIALAMGLPAAAFAEKKVWVSTAAHHMSRIPITGCMSDGTDGPSPAPDNGEKIIEMPAKAARELSYYKAASSPAVLAPRGWYCFGIYGANGSTLYISPIFFKKEDVFAEGGFDGPVIQASEADGDTPGRFEVARTIARAFPAHAAFAKKIIGEGVEPAEDFPFGLFPTDKVTYRNDEMIEFQTPPNAEGLGTMSQLRESKEPIDGAIILTGLSFDKMLRVTVRLPADKKDFKPIIIQQFEDDYADQPAKD